MYIEHMRRYSTATIPLYLRKGKTSASLPKFILNTIVNPTFTFIYNYVVRGGFLDGREGLLFHIYHSLYVNWKYAKAWIAAKQKTPAPVTGKPLPSVHPPQ
jgi:hypothetical protein